MMEGNLTSYVGTVSETALESCRKGDTKRFNGKQQTESIWTIGELSDRKAGDILCSSKEKKQEYKLFEGGNHVFNIVALVPDGKAVRIGTPPLPQGQHLRLEEAHEIIVANPFIVHFWKGYGDLSKVHNVRVRGLDLQFLTLELGKEVEDDTADIRLFLILEQIAKIRYQGSEQNKKAVDFCLHPVKSESLITALEDTKILETHVER
ncbi:hypothetical protein MG293_007886 [Ovis ammon polii]|uniref:Uncharacterized protein n=1 Tax=Ovis ammon polii TaxID=230172 RepID=A0AAD4U9H5_OVIAM|nr:hypothetical protein MG293_007886 [Ovis ammon polii]